MPGPEDAAATFRLEREKADTDRNAHMVWQVTTGQWTRREDPSETARREAEKRS